MTQPEKPINILLAEDNPNDRRLVEIALEESGLQASLGVVDNGEKLMQYLRREGEYANANLPDLILLDLIMPRKGGLEALNEIKDHPELREIPVFVFTSLAENEDISNISDHNVEMYIHKSADFDGMVEVLRSVGEFWYLRTSANRPS